MDPYVPIWRLINQSRHLSSFSSTQTGGIFIPFQFAECAFDVAIFNSYLGLFIGFIQLSHPIDLDKAILHFSSPGDWHFPFSLYLRKGIYVDCRERSHRLSVFRWVAESYRRKAWFCKTITIDRQNLLTDSKEKLIELDSLRKKTQNTAIDLWVLPKSYKSAIVFS